MEETSTLAALSSFLLHCVLQANKMFACRQFSLYLNIIVIKRISIKLFTDSMFWYNSSSIINATISSFRISLSVHFMCTQSMKIPPIWAKRAFLQWGEEGRLSYDRCDCCCRPIFVPPNSIIPRYGNVGNLLGSYLQALSCHSVHSKS